MRWVFLGGAAVTTEVGSKLGRRTEFWFLRVGKLEPEGDRALKLR